LKYNIIPAQPEAIQELLFGERQMSRRDDNVSIPLTTTVSVDGFYLTPIMIGEGATGKTFSTDFDTGTSDLWVLSTLLQNSSNVRHTLYDPTTSNSSILIPGETWSDTFQGTTEISGVVFSETVNIGGIIVKNQSVQAATKAIDALVAGSRDGLVGLGLGRSGITPDHFPTFVENLIRTPLQQPVFTCLVTRQSENPGFYTFGYIDETLSISDIQFNRIVTNDSKAPGQWELYSEYAVVNGVQIARPGNTAVVDTGTPGILLEEKLVKDIYMHLNGQFDTLSHTWSFPANVTTFPTLVLPVGTSNVTLTTRDFAIGEPDDSGWIFGSIQGRGQLPFDVFGHSWMNNIYAIFDLGITGPGITRFGLVHRVL